MINTPYQYQCSSRALAYNASILYKLRQSYLVIDIEPIVDKSPASNDDSFDSLVKNYLPYYCKYTFIALLFSR